MIKKKSKILDSTVVGMFYLLKVCWLVAGEMLYALKVLPFSISAKGYTVCSFTAMSMILSNGNPLNSYDH